LEKLKLLTRGRVMLSNADQSSSLFARRLLTTFLSEALHPIALFRIRPFFLFEFAMICLSLPGEALFSNENACQCRRKLENHEGCPVRLGRWRRGPASRLKPEMSRKKYPLETRLSPISESITSQLMQRRETFAYQTSCRAS
jgi:hypothetical protein